MPTAIRKPQTLAEVEAILVDPSRTAREKVEALLANAEIRKEMTRAFKPRKRIKARPARRADTVSR